MLLDVGSSTGSFVLLGLGVAQNAVVWAFEPSPLTLDIVRRNVELHQACSPSFDGSTCGRVRFFNNAVADSQGLRNLSLPSGTGNTGLDRHACIMMSMDVCISTVMHTCIDVCTGMQVRV